MRERVLAGPPDANETWVCGVEDVLSDGWEGKTTISVQALNECQPDEWLLIQAWDES